MPDNGYYTSRLHWEEFRNNSGETIPAWGVCVVTGSEMVGSTLKRPRLIVAKPSTTFYAEYVVNGPVAIGNGRIGRCTRGPGPVWIKYDSGTPANGEGWGLKPGQFTVSKGYPVGVHVHGVVDSTNKILLGTLSPVGTCLIQATAEIGASTIAATYVILGGAFGSESDAGYTSVPLAANRSGEVIANGETALLVRVNDGWEIRQHEKNDGSGGGGSSNLVIYEGFLNGDLDSDDTTATVDTLTDVESGTSEPSITSARNPLELSGFDNERCVVLKTEGIGPPDYLLLSIVGGKPANVIEGYIYSNFTTDDSKFTGFIELAYQGEWPTHLGVQQTQMQILNIPRSVDPHDRGPYVFEGEYGAKFRAELWPEADAGTAAGLGTTRVYRVVWVECPEESPVEGETGEGAQNFTFDLYGQGGMPQSMTAAYYGAD